MLEDEMRNPDLLAEEKAYKGRDEVPADLMLFGIVKLAVWGLADYQLIEKDFQMLGWPAFEGRIKGEPMLV